VTVETVPVLLTVEEAGVLLRIGRTKAYAMAREWRETDGRSGLPVVDLGHVLRVPRRALEDLIGAELTTDADTASATEAPTSVVSPAEPSEPLPSETSEATPTRRSSTIPRSRRRQNRIADQLDFFDSQPRST
jgi:hypothetical protein